MSATASKAMELGRLMELYQQADRAAAGALVASLSPQILGFYAAQLHDRSQAEDLLQEFWLRIHRARHTYRPGEPLLPWSFAIARRVLLDSYRKNKRIRDHEVQTEELQQLAVDAAPARTLPEMTELLQTLPPAQREVLTLLKVKGLTLAEVANLTGSTVGAVKQRAFRAYESLRKLFGADT